MNYNNKGKQGCTLCRKLFIKEDLTSYVHGKFCKECLEKYKQNVHFTGVLGSCGRRKYLK